MVWSKFDCIFATNVGTDSTITDGYLHNKFHTFKWYSLNLIASLGQM